MSRLFATLRLSAALLFLPPLAACAASSHPAVAIAPAADHHQHLFSPGIIDLIAPKPGPDALREIPVAELLDLLDSAGIRRAAVMSTAYMYGRPSRVVADEYARVKEENDWTAAQVAKHPERLRAGGGPPDSRRRAIRFACLSTVAHWR